MVITQEWTRYLKAVQEYQKKWPRLRQGQCFYNVAHTLFPQETESVCGADYDPFYRNQNLPMFLKKLNALLQGDTDDPKYLCPFCAKEVEIDSDVQVFPDGMISALGYCHYCNLLVETEGDS